MLSFLIAAIALAQPTPLSSGYIRTIDRTDGISLVQTEAKRLTAPGKPDVWLVGAAHIGQKAYYQSLQSLLDAQDVVLFEGVRTKDQPSNPSKVHSTGPKMIYEVFSDAIGLEFQLIAINYDRPNWINSDLTMEQLQRLNRASGNGKPTQFDMVTKMLAPGSSEATMLSSFFKSATPSMKEAFKIFIVDKMSKVESILPMAADPATVNIILTERNQSVEQVFGKTLARPEPPKSVAVFYGAAHMPEIEQAFRSKYGYRYAEQRWFTFASADHKKLGKDGKQFLDMLNSQVPNR